MATFRRGHSARKILRREVIVVEASGESTRPGKVRWLVDAADAETLRGLPAIGPGVSGAIRGTRPGDNL